MSVTVAGSAPVANRGGKDIAFAVGIVLILCLFFLPVPAVMIDSVSRPRSRFPY
jgi:flagellar biosynthesis protein FlhA